ncbi:kinase-like domain-containing protein [Syncephalis plumigaleata]|nr:kinase-like domain-containing protein [Syncephalis plumigaleata]
MELSDFDLIRSVGRGSFGRVMIVNRRSDNRVFALKYISKAQCVRQKAVRNIINERRILQRLSHPLVCNLQAAFQDDEHMYIMLDPMMGGDLAFHLERCEYFPENVVKFYICEIALALRYLHKQRIVHRDIKPANILLDERGHCHLTDFNVAGRIRRDKPMKSLAGTYSYMAPEVFQQKGYYESVDWWSLGVLMFELLYGKPPFRGKSKRSIGEAVLKHQITYPKKIDQKVSSSCTDAILSFLEPKARDRLGCKYRPFKEHPYFHDVEWEKMENKQLSSLFQPDPALVKTDALYHLEEVLLHEAPLQHKKRKKGTKPKTYPADSPWQLMLDEFKDFDREVWEKHQRDEEEKKQQMQENHFYNQITLE